MATPKRPYILQLDVSITAEEDEDDIDHNKLKQVLFGFFPTLQEGYIILNDGTVGAVEVSVTKRQLNRLYK